MENAGAIVDITGARYHVRNNKCVPVAVEKGVWGCTFEYATTSPFLSGLPHQEELKRLPENGWKPTFQFFYYGRAEDAKEPYRYEWRVADTCEPFVIKIGDAEIDPREMVDKGIQETLREKGVQMRIIDRNRSESPARP